VDDFIYKWDFKVESGCPDGVKLTESFYDGGGLLFYDKEYAFKEDKNYSEYYSGCGIIEDFFKHIGFLDL